MVNTSSLPELRLEMIYIQKGIKKKMRRKKKRGGWQRCWFWVLRWASLIIANILDLSLVLHGEAAVWEGGKELDDDPLR